MTYEQALDEVLKQATNAKNMADLAEKYIGKVKIALDALGTIALNKDTVNQQMIAAEALSELSKN